MPLKLNTKVYHRALGAAHVGHVDHGEWEAPQGAERDTENAIGHDTGEDGKADAYKYPIFKGDKVSAKGVGSALGYAKKNNESAIIPALQKISDAIADESGKNLSRALETAGRLADKLSAMPDVDVETLELSRAPRLARCPGNECGSHDVERLPAETAHEGPKDRCKICGRTWPHKPGTITAEQFNAQHQGEQAPDQQQEPEGEPEVQESGTDGTGVGMTEAGPLPFVDPWAIGGDNDADDDMELESSFARRA